MIVNLTPHPLQIYPSGTPDRIAAGAVTPLRVLPPAQQFPPARLGHQVVDLGYIDDDGYFFLVDRLKRMINASGFKVWPAEVEAQMYQHPAIQEACVIAARDAHRGETVKAIVVLRATHKDSTTEHDIIEWSRENMAVYKYPRIVQFVDALPKSATGKVQWRALQEAELARN